MMKTKQTFCTECEVEVHNATPSTKYCKPCAKIVAKRQIQGYKKSYNSGTRGVNRPQKRPDPYYLVRGPIGIFGQKMFAEC